MTSKKVASRAIKIRRKIFPGRIAICFLLSANVNYTFSGSFFAENIFLSVRNGVLNAVSNRCGRRQDGEKRKGRNMLVKCPVCQEEYKLEPGKHTCGCGANFFVLADGRVSLSDPGEVVMNDRTNRVDPDQTMAPQTTHDMPDPGFDPEKDRDEHPGPP